MGAGVIYDGVCSACAEAAKHKRCMTVVKWWSEGVSGPEICRRLGWSRGYLSVEMYRMREAGYDLPYRNRGYSKHAKVVAP
jgi:biotin operon repressor